MLDRIGRIVHWLQAIVSSLIGKFSAARKRDLDISDVLERLAHAKESGQISADEYAERLSRHKADLEIYHRLGSPRRFANVRATGLNGEPIDHSLSSTVVLHLSIGPRDSRSVVLDREPWPEVPLPGQIEIRVDVTSLDFLVSLGDDRATKDELPSILLLDERGQSRTPQGDEELTVVLRWRQTRDDSPIRSGRARLTYSYRDAVIQSQIVRVSRTDVGTTVVAETDYSASATLAELPSIPNVSRLAIVTNDDQDSHGFVLRLPASADVSPRPFSIPESALGPMIDALRTRILSGIGPDARRSRNDLRDDLRRLAPLGWNLYAKLFADVGDILPVGPGPRALIQIVRPRGVNFTLPWNYLYEIAIPSNVSIDRVPLCPLVERWDGRTSLVDPGRAECPFSSEVSHTSNLLCPFGFWGFRQPLESPATSINADAVVQVPDGSLVAFGRTDRNVDRRLLDAHLGGLADLLRNRFPQARVDVQSTRPGLQAAISMDLPLIYFFCHGAVSRSGSETQLYLNDDESISPSDVIGWIRDSRIAGRPIWNTSRPLVVINACQSGTVTPLTFAAFVDAFVGAGNGSGVVGTEVKVPQRLATNWADEFFNSLLKPDVTLQEAMADARLWFLARGSLFGLVYTTHSWAHLRLN